MSVCLDTKLAALETELAAVMGGATTLSDPTNNQADPMVQIALNALGGLCEVEAAIEEFKNGFNINAASCACLTILATLIGEEQRTNKRSTVAIVATGANGTVIPTGTVYEDSYTAEWSLTTQITIKNGFGWGVAQSEIGPHVATKSDLTLQDDITGVSTTNGDMLSYGYTVEDCDQFRARLKSAGGLSVQDTELTVIERLESLGTTARFITDAPDCVDGSSSHAFVVNGGDEASVAQMIMSYAPLNYTTLAGDVSYVVNSCETVKFMRPSPVGIEIEYYSKAPIDDSVFVQALCNSIGTCDNDVVTAMTFADIDKLKSIKLRPIYSRPADAGGDDITTGTDCFGTVSLISDACYDEDAVIDQEQSDCILIASWQYPVFVRATLKGSVC